MFVALLLIMGLSHILTGGLFLTPRNLNNLFLQTGYVAVLVIGMVLVIIGGQIDLAVGSVVACRAANAALLQVRHGAGTVTVIVVATFVVLYSYLTHRTKIGRSIYAVGGNPLAAEMSGINNCMSLLNAEAWLQYMVKGTVLVITVSFDIITRRKK